jgi:hypothetical protein
MSSPPPSHLIRRTVQRYTASLRKVTILSLPNDTLVDLIFIHLCVRDILRLRSVCTRCCQCGVGFTPVQGMQAILRTDTPANGLETHLAQVSPSNATPSAYHPLLLPRPQQPRGRASCDPCTLRGGQLAEHRTQSVQVLEILCLC